MAITLGSQNATEGTDFSTTVSGFAAGSQYRSLANNAENRFHLADLGDMTMTLTAAGVSLQPGVYKIVVRENNAQTAFDISVARAAFPAVFTVSTPDSFTIMVGDTVSVAAPIVSGGTGPYTYALIDAVGGFIRVPPLGFVFSNGGFSGTASTRNGLYGVVIEITDANGRKARTKPFSIPVDLRTAPTATPVNTALPAITGLAQSGQTLTVSNGTWSNNPTSYTYQWKRAGTAISSAIGATYPLVSADVGSTITCTVTATNAGGSASATSAATGVVTAASSLPSSVLFVTEGDSLDNFGLTADDPPYAANTQWTAIVIPAQMPAGPAYSIGNIATSGKAILGDQGFLAQFATRVQAAYDGSKALNVLWLGGETNDVLFNTGTPIYVMRARREIVMRARKLGYQRAVLATPPAFSNSPGVSYLGNTGVSAGYMRQLWSSDLNADALVDLAANVHFADYAATQDSAYYRPDGIHYINGGVKLRGQLAAPALAAAVQGATAQTAPPTTWSPLDISQFAGLSNGNRTAQAYSGAGGNILVLAYPEIRAAQKRYWEIVPNSGRPWPGIGTRNVKIATDPQNIGGNGLSLVWIEDGRIYSPGLVNTSAWSNGAVLGFALDMATKKLWVAINNAWQNGNPATGTGGIDLSTLWSDDVTAVGTQAGFAPAAQLYDNQASVTLRALASEQSNAPPTGFSAFPAAGAAIP